MNIEVVVGLFITVLLAVIGNAGFLWRKLGQLETIVKKKQCPFGDCPVFERAKQEAAPERQRQ